MGAYTTMTTKGQLTIPKEVRDELGLLPGTRFFVMVRDGEVVALPKNKSIADLAGILGPPPAGAGCTLEEMDEAVGQAVGEEDDRIRHEWNELRSEKL